MVEITSSVILLLFYIYIKNIYIYIHVCISLLCGIISLDYLEMNLKSIGEPKESESTESD